MNRDKKLLIKILRYIRDNADGEKALDPPDMDRHSPAEVKYHIGLGIQAGFIDGDMGETDANYQKGHTHRKHAIWGLTWKGHDEVEKNHDC